MSVNRNTQNIPHCRCNLADLHYGISPSERRRNARGISLGRNQGVDEGSAPRTMQGASTRSWCSRGLFIRFIPARPRSVRVCDCFCEKRCHALETHLNDGPCSPNVEQHLESGTLEIFIPGYFGCLNRCNIYHYVFSNKALNDTMKHISF
jgi:hypothetical protein